MRAKVHGVGTRDIRFTGINAMELRVYSRKASRRRGDCHGVAATNLIERPIKRAHGRVRLAAQSPASASGHRIRRSVWVKSGGRLVDLAALQLKQGQALWLPNGVEYAHNREYATLAARAAAAQRNLYDPDSCGVGPDEDVPLRITANWDADSNDERNLNGEWVDVRNLGAPAREPRRLVRPRLVPAPGRRAPRAGPRLRRGHRRRSPARSCACGSAAAATPATRSSSTGAWATASSRTSRARRATSATAPTCSTPTATCARASSTRAWSAASTPPPARSRSSPTRSGPSR